MSILALTFTCDYEKVFKFHHIRFYTPTEFSLQSYATLLLACSAKLLTHNITSNEWREECVGVVVMFQEGASVKWLEQSSVGAWG